MRSVFCKEHCDPPAGYRSASIRAAIVIPDENREVKVYFDCDRYEMKL